jgi:hypothetical protein
MSIGMTDIPWHNDAPRLKRAVRTSKSRKWGTRQKLPSDKNEKAPMNGAFCKKLRLKPHDGLLILKQPWWQYLYR